MIAPLDRHSPLPLWAQLEAELRRRLEEGEFAERFPTDAELCQDYAVSRHTVREAVRALNRTGVLRRERGRGTVVARPVFEQELGTLYSLFRTVEAQGLAQRSKVLELSETSDAAVAAELGLGIDEPLVHLARVRFAGDDPLAVDRAWLPAELARPLLEVDFSRTALYDELERRCGVIVDRGHEHISPILPSPEDRRLLGVDRQAAAFLLARQGRAGERPVEWRVTVVRGDRFRFVSDWSPRSAHELRVSVAEGDRHNGTGPSRSPGLPSA